MKSLTNFINKRIVEGVNYDKDNDTFIFDFVNDNNEDIVKLTNKGLYESELFNKCYFFKYEISNEIDKDVRKKFIEYIKFHKDMKDNDISLFIKNGIKSLDNEINLRDYECIIYPQSISEINRELISYIRMFSHPNFISYELIKKIPSKITFDYKSYEREVLDSKHIIGNRVLPKYSDEMKEKELHKIKKMMEEINNKDYFSIGRDMIYKYRKYINNFFDFKNKEDEEEFNSLESKKILIIDDIMTSGTTLSYIINKLKKIDKEKEIVIFSLIGKN